MATTINFNIANVASVASGASELVNFTVPVKRISIAEDDFSLVTPTGEEFPIKDKLVFPNRFGYPHELTFKNNGNAAQPLSIFIEEFGDVSNGEYYDEDEEE